MQVPYPPRSVLPQYLSVFPAPAPHPTKWGGLCSWLCPAPPRQAATGSPASGSFRPHSLVPACPHLRGTPSLLTVQRGRPRPSGSPPGLCSRWSRGIPQPPCTGGCCRPSAYAWRHRGSRQLGNLPKDGRLMKGASRTRLRGHSSPSSVRCPRPVPVPQAGPSPGLLSSLRPSRQACRAGWTLPLSSGILAREASSLPRGSAQAGAPPALGWDGLFLLNTNLLCFALSLLTPGKNTLGSREQQCVKTERPPRFFPPRPLFKNRLF